MVLWDFDTRLKTFKRKRGAEKWRHKIPSMVGMARSFFYYEPTGSLSDRVVCAACEAEFNDWKDFKRNPIERHANVTNKCFVSRLGSLSITISDAVRNGDVSQLDLKSACLPSFTGSGLDDISELLAEQGFYYMSNKSMDSNTVGCVSCLCFPQQARQSPHHAPKCPLAEIREVSVNNKETEGTSLCIHNKDSAKRESGGLEKPPKTSTDSGPQTVSTMLSKNQKIESVKDEVIIATQTECSPVPAVVCIDAVPINEDATPPAPEVTPTHTFEQTNIVPMETAESSLPRSSQEPIYKPSPEKTDDLLNICKKMHKDAEAAGKVIFAHLQDQSLDSPKTVHELIDKIELAVLAVLEQTHAKQINLIRSETETVVRNLISKVNMDLASLNTGNM